MIIFYLLSSYGDVQNVKQTMTSLLMEKSEFHSSIPAVSSERQKWLRLLRAACALLLRR